MAAKTEQFKSAGSNLGRTIGQSLSMITGKDIPNYSLLFLDATLSRKRGEHETIFMPHIVLGRSSRCHVRFGDEHKTVSREHASITVDGSNFVINHNPSASNPTYVNGRAIGGAHHLQNGDEIQLSSNGPKMRFNASTLKTSTIGLTSRIGQAMSQAVKPYKTALWIMGLLLLGALGLAGYNMYQNAKIEATNKEQANKIANLEIEKKAVDAQIANLSKDAVKNQRAIDSLSKIKRTISQKIYAFTPQGSSGTGNNSSSSGIIGSEDQSTGRSGIAVDGNPIENYYNYIYAIKMKKINYRGDEKKYQSSVTIYNNEWAGTGFLTSDGTFVTARHVLESWKWFTGDCATGISVNQEWQEISKLYEQKVISFTYEAVSPSGDKFEFTIEDMKADRSCETFKCDLKHVSWTNTFCDWASIKISSRIGKSKIKLNRNFSTELKSGTEIFSAGYANGQALQAFDSNNLQPLFVKGTISQSNLVNRAINSDINFEHGQSGGPVFALNKSNNNFEVIGIVHGGVGSISRIVPIWYVND